MQVTLKIFRYNPEVDTKFHYETYTIEGQETDRILDLLEHVKGYNDGTLSFRRSCAHGVCGSDAMRINGKNMLACKTLVRDIGTTITVEPLLGLKVIKDLIVDMEPFFDNYKKVLPYFINDSPLPAMGRSDSSLPKTAPALTIRPSVLCAPLVPPPVPPTGAVTIISVPPRWWPHIVLSSIAATKPPRSAWTSSVKPMVLPVAIRFSIVRWHARAIFRSRRRSVS